MAKSIIPPRWAPVLLAVLIGLSTSGARAGDLSPMAPDGAALIGQGHDAAVSARDHVRAALAAKTEAGFHHEIAAALNNLDSSGLDGPPGAYFVIAKARKALRLSGGRYGPADMALVSSKRFLDDAATFGRIAGSTTSDAIARQAGRAMLRALDRVIDGWDADQDGKVKGGGEVGLAQASRELGASNLAAR